MIEETTDPSNGEAGGESEELPVTEAFEVLADRRRRYLLYYLRAREGPVPLPVASRYVAAWERDVSPGSVTSEQCQRAYLDLYHAHVPFLEERDVVSYDQEAGTLSLDGMDGRLAAYTDEAMADENPIDEPSP